MGKLRTVYGAAGARGVIQYEVYTGPRSIKPFFEFCSYFTEIIGLGEVPKAHVARARSSRAT